MKKLILSATVAFTVLTTSNIYAQQGFGTNTPDRSSAVDIVSSKRGLLIPRIDIPNLDQAAPVSNPANALMVYNTGNTRTAAGFYYWDANFEHTDKSKGRWVRFVSSNSGSAVTVSAGTNVTVTPKSNGHDTDYNVSVKGGDIAGQVLVTKIETGSDGNPVQTTEWVNPQDFINGSVVGVNGITTTIVGDKVQVGLGGDLTKATEINTKDENTLAIKGLETLTKDKVAGNNIVVMGADGILKNVSAKDLIEDAIDKGTDSTNPLKAKTLKGDGITVTATGATTGVTDNVANSLLKDVTLGIADGAVKNSKIDAGAVTADKMTAKDSATGNNAPEGTVPVANADGTVTYKNVSTAIGQDLTTDGKIVIGDNKLDTLADAVLVATKLSIKEGSITNVELGAGAVTADKMTAKDSVTGNNAPEGTVPVAGKDGKVTYQQVTGELLNGKELKSTSIKVSGGKKALLDETTIEIAGGTSVGQVLVTKEGPVENNVQTYITEWVTPESLGNTVTASNGLTKTANDIALGGSIDKATTLTIAEGTKNSDGTVTGAGSLSISGLNVADSKQGNKTVVVQADGKLATVDTAAGTINITEGNVTIGGDKSIVNNYHPSMSEIVIEVTLGETDTNLNLPAVNGTEGQTISVKIMNTTETHKGYLVIKDDKGAFLSEGAMPFQGWIIKSNGTKWIVVGRN